MKYSYDRAPIRKIPLSGFLSMVSVRNKRIAAAPDSPPVSEYNANRLAKSLHPEAQYAKIARVDEHRDARSFTLVPDEARGTKSLAFFRASQYVSVGLNIGGTVLSKPYTIRSGPGSDYTAFSSLISGALVVVLDTSTPGWYQILFSSGGAAVTGWVSADYLALL